LLLRAISVRIIELIVGILFSKFKEEISFVLPSPRMTYVSVPPGTLKPIAVVVPYNLSFPFDGFTFIELK